ncbi:uncharacterized protein smash isoform X2 [Periplaneta americana]|uniref:uncharacterized protein smash isoform X2 n=1 Tax=Periplaneta americana TaxID=6978 RepID=UPI0037E7CC0A
MPGSMRRFSGTLEHPTPRRDAMDRRHSNASDTSLPDTGHVRQLSQENIEYIPTRITKVAAPKPAANPLQFIKVGPASLYKSAQEQLKKVEEIKKVTKEVRDEAEDWQSNLDNWKSSRRKRQEHIIERVVEVKKFEMEEYDRNRRRSKTFNEMMEERNSRGRKSSLVLFKDDDANDLTDLGIGASCGTSSISEEYGNDNHQNNVKDEAEYRLQKTQGNNGHHEDDNSSAATVSSPEPEEYTYERAIQGYVNFAETRVKSRSTVTRNNLNSSQEGLQESEKLSNGHSVKGLPSPPHTPRRPSGPKIEEKLSALEKRRRSSTEINNSVNTDRRMPMAKGDVLKRREMFERACELSEQLSKPTRRLSETTKQGDKAKCSESDSSAENEAKNSPHRLSNGNVPAVEQQSTDVEEPQKVLNGVDGSERSLSPEEDVVYETKRQQLHHSLDSLDAEGSSEGLEDLDCCGHPSSQSGDSGIHTADVSCSVSQADEPVDDGEIIAAINSVVPHLETSSSGPDVLHLEVEIVNQKHTSPETSAIFLDMTGSDKPRAGSVMERRKTVVEVCEKINIAGDGMTSPPPTPVITVPDTSVSPFQETDVLEQNVMLANSGAAPSEASTGSEKCETGDTEINDCTKTQELPSAENFAQSVPTDTKQEQVPNSSPEEEVFIPVSTSQIPPLNLASDVEVVAGLAFPLGPPTSAEPPKEKPPPPPTDLSDDEVPPVTSLKRLDSTKRIKKEIRRKRSDFLGIEGGNDDSYLEPELKVAPPPDMTTFLVEERRSEQQLYRQSICSETDSIHGETTDSRDSGVELDRAQSDDWPGKTSSTPDVLSAQHSRQNSDIYGTASITSEEDEIMKKEREIIEILEKEEQWRYRNNTTSEENDIGEKLAVKLHQLEQEKMRLEWERSEEENKRQLKENAQREEEMRLQAKEEELRQQESTKRPSVMGKEERIITASGEALQAERERLQRENEELLRQKENLQMHLGHQSWGTGLPPTHLSLQDISMVPAGSVGTYHAPTSPMAQSTTPLNYRLSLPDLQQEEQLPLRQGPVIPTPRATPNRRPPPPIPPAKPLRAVSQEQRERENSIRNSRMPSADSIPQHVESTHVHHNSVPAHIGSQPISRQTLQALSAVPRSRFISNDMWMQAKKKPDNQRGTGRESAYNYQHWLIQEAEHRRITEQQQRNAVSPRKPSHPWGAPQPQSQSQPQPQPQPSPRQDKPLPDAIIQTLTQRVQNRVSLHDGKNAAPSRRRLEDSPNRESQLQQAPPPNNPALSGGDSQEKMLSVSGKKKCSHCGEELGRGAAMIIESLRLFYHIDCFKCCVCHVQLGDGLMGTDVRVRNNKLHCHNCYSSDDGVKFSCV